MTENNEKCDLYRAFDASGALLYVGISWLAVRRVPQHSKKEWFDDVARVEIAKFESRDEALKAEKKAIIEERPLHNIIWTCARTVEPMDVAMTPAEIRQARIELGLTPAEIAPLLGYGAASRIYEIESGARNPSAAALRLLRAYLDGYRPNDWPKG